MPTCPRGHDSVATDYCDECGTPIGAAATPPPVVGPEQATAGAAGEPCPDCATPRVGRFCEVCGWDFLAETPPPKAEASPKAEAPPKVEALSKVETPPGLSAGGWRVL